MEGLFPFLSVPFKGNPKFGDTYINKRCLAKRWLKLYYIGSL